MGNIQSAAHTYGRNPRGFCLPSNQSHGLVTYGSDRNEKESIYLVFEELVNNGRARFSLTFLDE